MNYRVDYLALDVISSDQRFNLNSSFDINTLKESISAIGIIYPLIVWKHGNSILLIDGFKRFQIAKNSEVTKLPFIFLPANYTLSDVINVRYYNLKSCDTELNAHQKLSIYRLLEEACEINQILHNWRKLLNFKNPEKFQNILNWPEIAKEYIYNYNVSIKQLQPLINQNNQVINEIFSLAVLLSIRMVELNTIIEMISEIALNENQSMISILKRNAITSIIGDENLNRNQKILKLKQTIYEWRYPTITKCQKHLTNQLKKLSFNSNTQIHYDKSFEKPEIALSTKLKNEEDLDSFMKLITNKSKYKSLKKILASL